MPTHCSRSSMGIKQQTSSKDGAANVKRAVDAAQNALRINPQSSEGLTALAFAYGEGGQEGDAIRTARQAVGVAPNSAVAWQTLGYSCYYAGLNELAEQAWGRVVTLNPAPQPHWMHARMLLYSGKAKDAEEEMRSVVAANPDQFKALAYLGMMLYYEGKLDEAESELDRAVVLGHDSEDNTARLLAAFLYASRGQREKIDARLLQYRPEQIIDGDGAYWLGGIHALLGDRQSALDWLKRTVALGNVNYPGLNGTRTTTVCERPGVPDDNGWSSATLGGIQERVRCCALKRLVDPFTCSRTTPTPTSPSSRKPKPGTRGCNSCSRFRVLTALLSSRRLLNPAARFADVIA